VGTGKKNLWSTIGDKELYKFIMKTGTCEGLKSPHIDEADKSIEFVLDFPIDEYKLFDGFYWDLKQLRIKKYL